ncbi:hypothetical protein [Listeria grandensis]|nr:hypothetical protein [Listeria grandensis]
MGLGDYAGEIIKPLKIATVFDESQVYSNLDAYDNIKLLELEEI